MKDPKRPLSSASREIEQWLAAERARIDSIRLGRITLTLVEGRLASVEWTDVERRGAAFTFQGNAYFPLRPRKLTGARKESRMETEDSPAEGEGP